jgi:hypothetical protein
LVEWVNAHPSVLNKGWVVKDKAEGPANKPNVNFRDDLKVYEYYPAGKVANAKNNVGLQMLLRGLTQLGGNFKDGVYAYKRRAMFNDMKRHRAVDIDAPFSRGMFDRDMPQQTGGHGDDIIKFLEGGKEGSADLLKNLYQQIEKMLERQQRVKLSENSRKKMDDALLKISEGEKEANTVLLNEIKRGEIQRATGNRIDINGIEDDAEIKEIEERYLKKTKDVEKSSAKFIDALVTMLTVTVNGRK